ncbi:unnamed protein product [Polarella glacialis]|uniref:PH domain-containing protein n=1 Tax=Polarella glacialis TaxID=89957 RepID=A0A813IBA7_POLGL|nr:unnamed protein product [Polarella glacialis]
MAGLGGAEEDPFEALKSRQEGKLSRRRKGRFVCSSPWVSEWFVVTTEYLVSFSSRTSGQVQVCIGLTTITSVEADAKAKSSTFRVFSAPQLGRTPCDAAAVELLLKALEEEEMRRWVVAISDARERRRRDDVFVPLSLAQGSLSEVQRFARDLQERKTEADAEALSAARAAEEAQIKAQRALACQRLAVTLFSSLVDDHRCSLAVGFSCLRSHLAALQTGKAAKREVAAGAAAQLAVLLERLRLASCGSALGVLRYCDEPQGISSCCQESARLVEAVVRSATVMRRCELKVLAHVLSELRRRLRPAPASTSAAQAQTEEAQPCANAGVQTDAEVTRAETVGVQTDAELTRAATVGVQTDAEELSVVRRSPAKTGPLMFEISSPGSRRMSSESVLRDASLGYDMGGLSPEAEAGPQLEDDILFLPSGLSSPSGSSGRSSGSRSGSSSPARAPPGITPLSPPSRRVPSAEVTRPDQAVEDLAEDSSAEEEEDSDPSVPLPLLSPAPASDSEKLLEPQLPEPEPPPRSGDTSVSAAVVSGGAAEELSAPISIAASTDGPGFPDVPAGDSDKLGEPPAEAVGVEPGPSSLQKQLASAASVVSKCRAGIANLEEQIEKVASRSASRIASRIASRSATPLGAASRAASPNGDSRAVVSEAALVLQADLEDSARRAESRAYERRWWQNLAQVVAEDDVESVGTRSPPGASQPCRGKAAFTGSSFDDLAATSSSGELAFGGASDSEAGRSVGTEESFDGGSPALPQKQPQASPPPSYLCRLGGGTGGAGPGGSHRSSDLAVPAAPLFGYLPARKPIMAGSYCAPPGRPQGLPPATPIQLARSASRTSLSSISDVESLAVSSEVKQAPGSRPGSERSPLTCLPPCPAFTPFQPLPPVPPVPRFQPLHRASFT